MPPAPGQMLLHYRLIEKIGEGGMGDVYLAEDTKLKRRVALKVLSAAMAATPERLERFQREAEAVAALDHPNIVTLYSVDEAEGVRFLTMGLVEGQSLDQMLPEQGHDLEGFFDIAIPLADALDAAHVRGITHRDVKPANVMVTAEGRVKVLDFGLAKLQEPDSSDGTEATITLTRQGLAVGTVPYMPPEQLEGKDVDPRADIFSLGIVLYELATGQRPFPGESGAQVISSILRDTPPTASDVKPGLPGQLSTILRRCLEKDREDRYQTVKDVRNDLRGLQGELSSSGIGPAARFVGAGGPAQTSGPVVPRASQDEAPASATHRSPRIWLAASAILIALATVVAWRVLRDDEARNPASAAAAAEPPGIVVLPLTNLSGDPENEYFADGMTETLITDLAKIGGLRVISRGSAMRYKATDKTLPEVARELNVDYVLEGSVLPVGERVRITAQLVRAADDVHVWAEDYEEDLQDILSVQGRVARAVAQEVRVKLSPQEESRLASDVTVDPEAYRLYLQGRFFWNQRTPDGFRRSLDYFSQATQRDPGFAQAWAGQADAYTLLAEYAAMSPEKAFPLARQAALRALELDENLGEAHAAIGEILHYYDWDLEASEDQFLRAIELSPGYATAHMWYAELLANMKRYEEAYAYARQAIDLDPHSPVVRFELASDLLFGGRYEESLDVALLDVEREPGFWLHHVGAAHALSALGRHDEAIGPAREAVRVSGGASWASCSLGYVLARAGQTDEAREIAARLEREGTGTYATRFRLASVHAALGDVDRAFAVLDEAIRLRDPQTILINTFPVFDELHDDPRWDGILRRLGLDEFE